MTDSPIISIRPARWAWAALPWLLLAIAALPAAWPYVAGAGLPRTNDALPHLYRTLALDRLVRAGELWPRWSPDLVHGFGYPVFNFFPALSHYLVGMFHLIGLPLATAYRAAVVTHCVLTFWFTYLLARDLFGPVPGWIGALAYVYSPYLLYDAHVRGGLPENQALMMLPLLLFALRRSVLHGGRWIALVAVAFAAAFLSHFPITFQFLLPIGLLLLWMGRQTGWRCLWQPVAGLALGILLTTFFWLPTLAEVQFTRTDFSISLGYSYEENFMSLGELLAWPHLPADPALVNPPVVRALPQVALLLAVLLFVWRWRGLSLNTRREMALWGAVLLLCTALITPAARPVWDTLPLLRQTLYPWRFLGPASLAGALLLAATCANLDRNRRGLPLLALLTLLLTMSAVPWLFMPREPVPESPTLGHLMAFEQPPFFIGTTTLGEFLPRWVEEIPDDVELRQQLAVGLSPDRLVAPPGIQVERLRGSVLDATYRIQVDGPAWLTYRQFYFPGWRVTLDGQPLPTRPAETSGLLEFEIPAGVHTLRIHFGSTPPRMLGVAMSVLALLVLVAMGVWRWPTRVPQTLPAFPQRWLLLLSGLVLATGAFFARVETPLRCATLESTGLRGAQHPLLLDFVGEVRLLGYEQSAAQITAADEVAVTLYWQPQRPLGVVYDVALHIVAADGFPWSSGELVRPRDWRFAPGTDLWPVDGYVMDSRLLRLVDGAPPGEYTFRVALVRRDIGQTVAAHSIGALRVSQPGRGALPLETGLMLAPQSQPWTGLRLLGSRIDRRSAAPGDIVRLTLLWQVEQPQAVADEGWVALSLAAEQGDILYEDMLPVARSYPLTHWQVGDRLRMEVVLRLPVYTPDGEHTWQVRSGVTSALPLGVLRVTSPTRLWEAPVLPLPVDELLGEVIRLLGADIQPVTVVSAPADLHVTLVWRSEAETEISYRVFLHLLSPAGELLAQSDGEPAQWHRPTTGWLPGEVVLDEHVLHLPAHVPAGVYTLLAGLYAPDGARLTTSDGRDGLWVTEVNVAQP